jgi:hypothetical protein
LMFVVLTRLQNKGDTIFHIGGVASECVNYFFSKHMVAPE